LLQHADKLAELHTGMTCRIGLPVEQLAHGYHQNVSSPIFSTGIGLLLRGMLDLEEGRAEPAPKATQPVEVAPQEPSNAVEEKSGSWLDSVFRKTKEWFEADPEVDLEKTR
jgi:cell division protein FtsA